MLESGLEDLFRPTPEVGLSPPVGGPLGMSDERDRVVVVVAVTVASKAVILLSIPDYDSGPCN